MLCCVNPDCQNPLNPDGTKFCQSCGSKLVPLLRNRYRLIQPIGQGGFGRTYLAEDVDKLNERCVVKQFTPQSQGTAGLQKAVQLFEQEARRLQELGEHPQIPTLFAYFEEDKYLYLAQQFIEGRDLSKELGQQGAFSEKQIRELLSDLLPVLKFIHQRQVIHRDIKPENIIRRRSDRQLVLVDFGAAKFASGTAMQRTGTVIGSLGYIAPEQSAGKAVFASDIYSLGVTCICLLTGTDPFELFDVDEADWVWREHLSSSFSDSLGQVLDKMLELAPKRRYQAVDEVIYALNPQTVLPKRKQVSSSTHQTQNSRCVRTLTGHSNWVKSIAISPDGQTLASGSLDGTVKIWNVDNGQLLDTLWENNSGAVLSVAISPDRQTIAAGCEDGKIRVWNFITGRFLRTLGNGFHRHSVGVTAIAFSSESQLLVSGSTDGRAIIWNLSTGKGSSFLLAPTGGINAITFIFGSRLLAVGSQDTQIKIRSANQTHHSLFMLVGIYTLGIGFAVLLPARLLTKPFLAGHSGGVNAVASNFADNKILASGSADSKIILWKLKTRNSIVTLSGHSGSVDSVAFSPDGKILASGSADKTIMLWNLTVNPVKSSCTLTGHSGAVNSIAFTPDGRTLASGSSDNTIKIWRISP